MTDEDVQNAIRAYDLFKSVGWYTAHYREHLEKASQVLRCTDAVAVNIKVVVTPEKNACSCNVLT